MSAIELPHCTVSSPKTGGEVFTETAQRTTVPNDGRMVAIYVHATSRSRRSVADQLALANNYVSMRLKAASSVVYSDNGIEGPFESRPALRALLHHLDEKTLRTIVVSDLECLSTSYVGQMRLQIRVERAGAELVVARVNAINSNSAPLSANAGVQHD